jgi:hypothetical protein
LNLSILSRALAAASFSLLAAGVSDELEVSSGAASTCSDCSTFGLSSVEADTGGVWGMIIGMQGQPSEAASTGVGVESVKVDVEPQSLATR